MEKKIMTFATAALEMKDGDVFVITDTLKNDYYSDIIAYDHTIGEIWFNWTETNDGVDATQAVLSRKGYIKKAERVLSPEEIEKSVEDLLGWGNQWKQVLIKKAHKNGRLERDLELRDIVEQAQKVIFSEDSDSIKDLKTALENLKPLNKKD